MPEHDCLPPDVSATEFVVHMARMSGLPPAAARERTADTLRHVGLYEERYRPIGGYSTGMKQRVKLAQALVHDPQLVLLDEPTNGLDPVGRDEMLGLIRRIHTDFGISVLVTSHLLGELERTCDHVVVIDGGKLLRSSSTSDFTQTTAIARGRGHRHRRPPGRHRRAARRARPRRAWSCAARPSGPARRRPHPAGRAAGEETYDLVRDTVADLGLGLVRMEQRRHHIAEVFHDATTQQDARTPERHSRRPHGRRGRSEAAGQAVEHRATAPAGTQRQIHNIGYRHYDGPRLGRAYARRSLFSQSPARRLRPRPLGQVQGAADAAVRGDVRARGASSSRSPSPPRPTTCPSSTPATRSCCRPSSACTSPPRRPSPSPATCASRRSRCTSRGPSRRVRLRAWPSSRRMASALFVLTARAAADPLRRARCWPSSTSPTRPRASRQGLVSVALLSLLFAGIGLVVAALTPRRGFGVAAVIAVLTISYGAVSTRPGHRLRPGQRRRRQLARACSRPITLIDGVQTAFLGAHLRLPRRGRPRHRRPGSSTSSSSSASSPARTAC